MKVAISAEGTYPHQFGGVSVWCDQLIRALTSYDFAAKSHDWAPIEEYDDSVALLRKAQSRNPALAVYTLDYWDPDDAAGIARIYAMQRASGFIPYVATIGLDRIVPEPAA